MEGDPSSDGTDSPESRFGRPWSARYDDLYASGPQPWEIGGPQPALVPLLPDLPGPAVLDVGCGTGDLAIALARLGFEVTAVDVSAVAVAKARERAAAAGVAVRFSVGDATRLPPGQFDTIVDSGLLHTLHRFSPPAAAAYLSALPGLTRPGGVVVVLAVSDSSWGVTSDFLRDAFAGPAWAEATITDAPVAASADGDALTHAGWLLRAVRA